MFFGAAFCFIAGVGFVSRPYFSSIGFATEVSPGITQLDKDPIINGSNNLNGSNIQTIKPSSVLPTITVGARWEFTPTEYPGSYKLTFNWLPFPGAKGYSAEVSKKAGSIVTQSVDTTNNSRVFKSVSSGEWYVNLAILMANGEWTKVYYWRVTTPDVISPAIAIPTLGPSKIPAAIPAASPDLTDISSDDAEVLGMKSKVAELLKSIEKSSSSTSANSESSTTNVNSTSGTQDLNGKKIGNITCDCSKTCKKLFSCDEAYQQLNTCGCTALDPDDDGIPCNYKCEALPK